MDEPRLALKYQMWGPQSGRRNLVSHYSLEKAFQGPLKKGEKESRGPGWSEHWFRPPGHAVHVAECLLHTNPWVYPMCPHRALPCGAPWPGRAAF